MLLPVKGKFNQIKLSLSNKTLRSNEDDDFKKYYIFIEG